MVLRQAPHIVEPLSFVLPHEPHLRPAWMIRAGLFLYDRLGGGRRCRVPSASTCRARRWGAGLKPKFGKGFVYSDARVDDARLVVFNVMDAQPARRRGPRAHDARVRAARTRCAARSGARRSRDARARTTEVTRAERSSTPPGRGSSDVRDSDQRDAVEGGRPPRQGQPHRRAARARRRARVHPAERRQPDRLRHSVPGALHADRHHRRAGREPTSDPQISDDEIDYLLELANTLSRAAARRSDVVWTYSGVRPLYDDGASDPSAVTRDYVLKVDALDDGDGGARRCCRSTAARSRPIGSSPSTRSTSSRRYFPPMKAALDAQRDASRRRPAEPGPRPWSATLIRRYPELPAELLRALARRHGTRARRRDPGRRQERRPTWARTSAHGLTAREIDYLRARRVGAHGRRRAVAPDQVRLIARWPTAERGRARRT